MDNIVTPFTGVWEYSDYDNLIFKAECSKIDVLINLHPYTIERGMEMAICGKCGQSTEYLVNEITFKNKLDAENYVKQNGNGSSKLKIIARPINITNDRCDNCKKTMTPQEELFAAFFKAEKTDISELSDLDLRARREELSRIAFEARARLTAVDEVKKERASKGKTKGFEVSLEPDVLATDAINKIKTRQGKIDKTEKLILQMMKTGMDRKTAESLLQAGTIAARLKDKIPAEKAEKEAVSGPVHNPFLRNPPETKTEVTINEETNTVIIKETEEPKETYNPFKRN